MRKKLLLFLFTLIAFLAKAQWIDSVRVLNKNYLNSNDTIIVKVYGYFAHTGWGIDTSWCNVNGNSIDLTIKSCSHGAGLSVIILYNVNKKIIPLNSGLYNLKVKILGYSNTIINNVSIPCSTVATKDSSMTTFQVNEPNSVKEINILNGLKIYPNPITDNFRINCENQNVIIEKLTILNVLKQNVFEISNPAINKDLDITHLNTGIYFLNIQFGIRNKTIKIVKQ